MSEADQLERIARLLEEVRDDQAIQDRSTRIVRRIQRVVPVML